MLRRLNVLLRSTIVALDGPIGRVHDVYFDDHSWTVRYVVADTGRWLPGRRVLISPISVRNLDRRRRRLNIDLTKDQIRKSPDIDTDKPVSRQHEVEFYEYLGFPYYWMGSELWGPVSLPADLRLEEPPADPGRGCQPPQHAHEDDPHLRSARFVVGHAIQTSDAEVGHVEGFLYDEASWAIRYLVVDTRDWWPGKHILVPSASIAWVSWLELRIHADLPSETLRNAPAYRPSRPFLPEDERRLLSYYGPLETAKHGAPSGAFPHARRTIRLKSWPSHRRASGQ
jgi:hypothetical protein